MKIHINITYPEGIISKTWTAHNHNGIVKRAPLCTQTADIVVKAAQSRQLLLAYAHSRIILSIPYCEPI